MTDDLAARLLAAIEETERIARDATPGPWRPYDVGDVGVVQTDGEHEIGMMMRCEEHADRRVGDAAHIARQDPAATLIRCEADRELVDLYRAAKALAEGVKGSLMSSAGELVMGAYEKVLDNRAKVYGVEVEAPAAS